LNKELKFSKHYSGSELGTAGAALLSGDLAMFCWVYCVKQQMLVCEKTGRELTTH